MKYFAQILIAVLSLFLLKECLGLFYIRMTHLSKDDLEWVNGPKSQMSAIFVSDSGNISKLSYTSFLIANSSDPFFISSSKGAFCYFEANAWYKYVINDSKRTLNGSFGVARLIDEDSLCAIFSLGAMSTSDNYKQMKLTTFKLKNRIFENCLVIDTMMVEVPSRKRDSTSIMVNKFVISKKYGPIYYKLKDGEEFYRNF